MVFVSLFQIITLTGFNVLPQPDEPITILLAEALHFRTGFHYIMVREMEMQIPIPSLPDGGPDFEIVSKNLNPSRTMFMHVIWHLSLESWEVLM